MSTRIAGLLLIAALLIFGGAATCQKPTNPVVAGAINCAEQGVHNAALVVIDDVASALATGDYMAALADLVKKFGEGAVDCAVREVAGTSVQHAQIDQLEATKAEHAKAWLASRPVTFSSAMHWQRSTSKPRITFRNDNRTTCPPGSVVLPPWRDALVCIEEGTDQDAARAAIGVVEWIDGVPRSHDPSYQTRYCVYYNAETQACLGREPDEI